MQLQIRTLLRGLVAATLCLGACVISNVGDTHIFAGALGTNQGDKLTFSNGVLFDAALTNLSLPQIMRTNGLNAGYYRGDALTFTSLPGTIPNGGPIPGHAAFGSRLAVEVISVRGPAGGSFAFWEGDGESALGVVAFDIPVGTTNGTNFFVISEGDGSPGSDPYGHFHGRAFTTSAPGTYIVGFRVIDLSSNGAGGGPIHMPSDVLPVRFQAGLRIEKIQTFADRATVSFRSPPGISVLLESTDAAVPGNWLPAAGPLRGNNNLQTFIDTNAPAGNRFYRLLELNKLP